MENERLFRLSIWCPAKLARPLDYTNVESQHLNFLFEPERLFEQIYVWEPGQDDVFICLDATLAHKFRQELIEKFAPHIAPETRNMAHFANALESLKLAIHQNGHLDWVDSEQIIEININECTNLRVNTALSMLHHFHWVLRTFEHVPGASVVIR
ncbi:hypothetical protein PN36_32375 [Candidatus Thiomargarita nelsonii]|uniref:Uncharacterized protein n=1 Tax=Candidatus Thiomargarita nelsonii TaxID=1003181 RepID=A0A0A6P655_9GAMM|nr:hypothetical protein PN36_32375 [Candidatus Thiomargarita nelsonii]